MSQRVNSIGLVNGELIVYNTFTDYVLSESEFKENENAKQFLMKIFNSEIPLNPETAWLDSENSSIKIRFWMDGSMDEEDFFNVRYNDMYYETLEYFFNEDRYVLISVDKVLLDSYKENGQLDKFAEYSNNIMFDTTLEINEEELRDVYFRLNNYSSNQSLNYIQPFN